MNLPFRKCCKYAENRGYVASIFIIGSSDDCNHYYFSVPVGYHIFKIVISSNPYSKCHENPCHSSAFS